MEGWAWRYAPHAALATILGLGALYAVHILREQGRAELRPEIERLEKALAASEADRARAENASDAYRSEVDALRARPVPRVPVRLCVTGDAVPRPKPAPENVIGTPTTAWGDRAPSGDNLAAGPDIGPDLYALAQACDVEQAKLRALQGWIDAVR